MSVAAIWAWVLANEAAVATVLLSEFLGSIPAFKSNGLVSFVILQVREMTKKKGGIDPTP
jgi:hypothetical protein